MGYAIIRDKHTGKILEQYGQPPMREIADDDHINPDTGEAINYRKPKRKIDEIPDEDKNV